LPPSTLLVRLVALGLGLVPGPGAVLAQGFQITPVQVELTAKARTAIVTIHNLGSEPLRLQVSAFSWDQDAKGEMRLARTKDVTFFPSLLTIAPGQKRNLRVGVAAPVGEVEKTYRVFVEQLQGGPGAPAGAVRVLTRVGIPVYLEPPKPSHGAELSPIRVDGRKISFLVRNTGNVRLRPERVKVIGADGAGQVAFDQSLPAWYVLAGGERIYETEAPRDRCARVRTLSAEVQVGDRTLRVEQPAAGGVCGP
jgi:fimbrial chaperone protein